MNETNKRWLIPAFFVVDAKDKDEAETFAGAVQSHVTTDTRLLGVPVHVYMDEGMPTVELDPPKDGEAHDDPHSMVGLPGLMVRYSTRGEVLLSDKQREWLIEALSAARANDADADTWTFIHDDCYYGRIGYNDMEDATLIAECNENDVLDKNDSFDIEDIPDGLYELLWGPRPNPEPPAGWTEWFDSLDAALSALHDKGASHPQLLSVRRALDKVFIEASVNVMWNKVADKLAAHGIDFEMNDSRLRLRLRMMEESQ